MLTPYCLLTHPTQYSGGMSHSNTHCLEGKLLKVKLNAYDIQNHSDEIQSNLQHQSDWFCLRISEMGVLE